MERMEKLALDILVDQVRCDSFATLLKIAGRVRMRLIDLIAENFNLSDDEIHFEMVLLIQNEVKRAGLRITA